MSEAMQTPMVELLRAVTRDAVKVYESGSGLHGARSAGLLAMIPWCHNHPEFRPMGPRRIPPRQDPVALDSAPHVAGVQGVGRGGSGDACASARQLAVPWVQVVAERGGTLAMAVFLARTEAVCESV